MAAKERNSLIGFDPLAWMEHDNRVENVDELPYMPVEERECSYDQDNPDAAPTTEAEPVQATVSVISEGSSPALVLDAVLNIQQVARLHEELLNCMDRQNKIEIDASAVTTVDTASLQLLIVVKQTALKNGKELVIDFPSEKFIEAAELLGVSEMLEVDRATAGFF